MKIKDYFKKWEKISSKLFFLAFLAWFLIIIGEILGSQNMMVVYILLTIFAICVCTAIFISITQFVCPRCERKLKIRRRTVVSNFEECPYCEKDFNENKVFSKDFH